MGDITYKLLMLGDAEVGKTQLAHQFTRGKFNETYRNTINLDFSSRTIDLANKKIKLQLWEIGGQQDNRNFLRAYFKETHAFIIVVDLTQANSIESLNEQLKLIAQYKHSESKSPIYVVINKNDLSHNFKRTLDEVRTICSENKLPEPFSTNAKDKASCDAIFTQIATEVHSLSSSAQLEITEESDNKGKNPDNKRILTEAEVRANLIEALKKYKDHVNPDKKTNIEEIDFTFNLKYFTRLRAKHRRQNYDFAEKMIEVLDEKLPGNTGHPKFSLESILENALSYRCFSFNYATKDGHHINSNGADGLNQAIRDAKRALEQLNKATKKRSFRFICGAA